jgi:signal transduction histidine kinase
MHHDAPSSPAIAGTGPYRAARPLGSGAFASVYAATASHDGRPVLLKVARTSDARTVAAFRREHDLGARWRHPHLGEVLDYGTAADGRPYLVLAAHEGDPLTDQPGPWPAPAIAALGAQLARALVALHADGFAHRDLAPANVLLDPRGHARLIDFGLLAPHGEPTAGAVGTPPYVAPEVLAGHPADARSDLYALGALLYRQATGQAPFEGMSPEEALHAALHEPPTPVTERAPHLDAALAGLIMRLLAKEPGDRPTSARAVLQALTPLAPGPWPVGDGRWQPSPAFETWVADRPSCAALTGEPGWGRTRHLREAFSHLRREGRAAVRLAAEPEDVPFALAERLWRWAAAQAGPDATGLTATERGLVASLWPWAFPGATPPDAPDGLEPVLRRGLAAMLRAAAGGPLTVLIDDWDRADSASRHLIAGLWREAGFDWLLAGREAPAGVTPLPLAPLGREDAIAWLHSAWPGLGGEQAAMRVHRATGGNPGWMRLVAGRAGADTAIGSPDVPATVQALLAEQWAAVGPDQQRLAEAIAIYARPFRAEELATAGAWLGADWPLGLGALVESGVLACRGETYRFRHGWWAGFIEARLAPGRRAALATGLARTLEALWRPVVEPQRLHRLATLFERGEDPDLAIRYALAAGTALARVFANEAAEAHFASGLDAIAHHPQPERYAAERRALAIGRADVQRLTGALAEAAAAYESALDQVLVPTERARLLVSLGKTRQMLNRYAEASVALEEAIALLGPDGPPMERLRALTALGRVQHFLGDREGSLRHYESALALGREAGVPAFTAEALAFLGTLRAARADSAEQGLAELAEALAMREAMADQLGRNDTHMLLGNALFAMGRPREAVRHFEANRAIAEAVGQRQEEAFAHLNLALCELELGDWSRAASALEQARRLAAVAGDAFLLGLGAFLESLARLHLGDMAGMERALSEARERESAQANPTLRLYGLVAEAERHLFLGAFEQARRAAELAVGALAHGSELTARSHLLLAEAWLHAGQGAAASDALAAAEAAILEAGAVAPRAQSLRLRGWLAYREGRRDEARAAWQTALAVAQAQGLTHWEAQLLLHLAMLARHDPDAGSPAQELERAYAIAERAHAPEPLALGCLALGVRQLDDGQELFAERLFRRGHELLGHFTQALGSPGARAAFLAHPARAPFCEVRALTEAHLLQRRGRRLEMLLELGRTIGATRDPARVLEQVRSFTLEVTQAERCLILQDGPEGLALVGEDAPYSRTIVRRVQTTGEPACVLDTQADEALRDQASILDLRVRAVMCVPLVVAGRFHGVLYVDSRVALGAFTPEDLRCVEAIAKQAAVAIDNAGLHQALATELKRQGEYIRRLEESEHVIRHLEELDRVRGEYFQAASHDLRAPLASIHVSCQALLKGLLGPLDSEQAEAIEGVHHGARSLMSLIDGILDAAKLEAGRLILNPQPVPLVKPVRESVRLLRALATAKGLELRWDEAVLAALPPASGDERRLQQVVLNLLSNAIKFTDRGHVAINGRVVGDRLELAVSDTGPGLPADRRERLFERYGASQSGAIAGSGLGLWLVKGLVDLHQGTLAVDSAEGRGTTFRIELPITT